MVVFSGVNVRHGTDGAAASARAGGGGARPVCAPPTGASRTASRTDLDRSAYGNRCSDTVERYVETNYNAPTYLEKIDDEFHLDRTPAGSFLLAAVLTLGARDLRRELDAIVINADSDMSRDSGEPTAEVYVLSVAPRTAEGEAEAGGELAASSDGSIRLQPHFQVVCGGELRALLLRAPGVPRAPPTRVHTQVDYIHCLVPDLQQITACSFYWGKMDRYEAERLLDNKPEGTFLLRDSAQEEHLFSVSFRKYGRSLHARIEHYRHRFSFDSHDPAVFAATTVTGLIDHYKDPACVMFFEPMLTAPLPRAAPFSLQQLARAVIVSHTTYDGVEQLPLPPRLRAFLKEYHYRQRVRVRRLEPDLYDHHC
ncbi:unnamed protein product [Diatraea saccharalis]|uniref:Suppressor of cytokine signaling 5 n=1 Tax=Diatraea saccharalis TaxID=40085 RepID=A0A9N9R5E8_9NEOP|nr:unnamed protein product [Diatraea saccharalis]